MIHRYFIAVKYQAIFPHLKNPCRHPCVREKEKEEEGKPAQTVILNILVVFLAIALLLSYNYPNRIFQLCKILQGRMLETTSPTLLCNLGLDSTHTSRLGMDTCHESLGHNYFTEIPKNIHQEQQQRIYFVAQKNEKCHS